ncbi:sensor histidine kinase [Bacillus sp. 1NLA3E]|uniref:sensor histidine kinase n=1 Tax=Bacillus sp. 1NLA3E TaxID=666686 RepID=UPI000247F205|nr:histidine kinase [Bacillus sp. 1NLA3E]AGK52831.1 integral membrane sensor signal transduction histidine kinase [Bacillus sp. 1NLA3E]
MKIVRIQTKLLLYFIILVVLLSGITLFMYKSSEKIIAEYDNSFSRFLILNDISQQTNLVIEKLNGYVIEKDQSFLHDYYREKKQLLKEKQNLMELNQHTSKITVRNYQNTIDSFIEECDQTIVALHQDDIIHYSLHLSEAMKISGFIQETTLSLINTEFSNYQDFYQKMKERNHYQSLIGIALFSATLIFSAMLALWISGGITMPIRRLSNAAKEIANGRLDGEDVHHTSNDELKLLTETFNTMRGNIRVLVSEIQQKSKLDTLLKELELKSLQSQVNPHFLFNVLNTVSKTAYLEEATQTSRLIESVSTLLRYNLSDLNRPSTIRDEMKIVKEYFYIQQARFFDRIDFKIAADERCLDREIPCLILQPLIENAFIHGVESYEQGGKLHLKIVSQNDRIVIEVTDNGVGMDENIKARLVQYIEGIEKEEFVQPIQGTGHSTGIGVKNVIKRLQLFYQRMDIMEIESSVGIGTTFRIFIPNAPNNLRTGEANC